MKKKNSNHEIKFVKSTIIKGLLIFCGILFVFLGILGILLPLLPTTPLLLLAAACFIRSSERLYNWLVNNRWLGSYIKNYREHKAVGKRTKILTLLLLWLALSYSAIVVVNNLYIRILLLIIGIGVTIHVLSLRTLSKNLNKTNNSDKEENGDRQKEKEMGKEMGTGKK